jgi:hypothetical protein
VIDASGMVMTAAVIWIVAIILASLMLGRTESNPDPDRTIRVRANKALVEVGAILLHCVALDAAFVWVYMFSLDERQDFKLFLANNSRMGGGFIAFYILAPIAMIAVLWFLYRNPKNAYFGSIQQGIRGPDGVVSAGAHVWTLVACSLIAGVFFASLAKFESRHLNQIGSLIFALGLYAAGKVKKLPRPKPD